jgi:hypothetical protein
MIVYNSNLLQAYSNARSGDLFNSYLVCRQFLDVTPKCGWALRSKYGTHARRWVYPEPAWHLICTTLHQGLSWGASLVNKHVVEPPLDRQLGSGLW